MASKIQLRRGTASQWTTANPVLSVGEPGVEVDTGRVKFGNGVSAWANLPYAGVKNITYDMLPPGSTLTLSKVGSIWPERPTPRADITVLWKGSLPAPPGFINGSDYQIIP